MHWKFEKAHKPYNWEEDWHFLATEGSDPLKDAHAALVGDLVETELEAQNTLKTLREIERIFNRRAPR